MPRYEQFFHYPGVLSIAGSDSGGGAGIQADLKTIAALGCYGCTAITAVTVQNSCGITAIHPIPVAVVEGQIRTIMNDIRPVAIKIGMLYSAEILLAVARVLKDYPDVPVIADPVLMASSGDLLVGDTGFLGLYQRELFPLITLLTPNLDEAAAFTGAAVRDAGVMPDVAATLVGMGCNAVLVKGGHLPGPALCNVYLHRDGSSRLLHSTAINSPNTHGTGCTLSSAIAAFLATGLPLAEAAEQATAFVHEAIAAGRGVRTGAGSGPVNHGFSPTKMIVLEKQQNI